jgi:HK97 family phage major capsid protein
MKIVTNQNMPVEGVGVASILVGAFAQASQIWRRRSVTLAVSDSHNDNFGKGILVIKATSRLAVTHYRPAGYALVTLVNT